MPSMTGTGVLQSKHHLLSYCRSQNIVNINVSLERTVLLVQNAGVYLAFYSLNKFTLGVTVIPNKHI
jgi:hypothetical protein